MKVINTGKYILKRVEVISGYHSSYAFIRKMSPDVCGLE